MMGVIRLEGLQYIAYHGVFEEERILGKHYELTIEVTADVQVAAETDRLEATQDYGVLASICHEEMALPSQLLEHVLHRIITRVKSELDVEKVKCILSKLDPPINGRCLKSVVELEG